MPIATTSTRATKRFCLILVKPSHYDDDGYVIQWFRSTIPSNSLAAVFGLARDCAQRHVLGEDVAIEIHPFDETNTRIRPERLARMIEEAGAGMVMMIGVQSNQFPHALDLAKPLRERGIQVGIGGFHVSGILSMMDGNAPICIGPRRWGFRFLPAKRKGAWRQVLKDAFEKKLKPLYNYMADLPNIEGEPIPLIPAIRAARTAGAVTSFDAGRGCPFQCSFCTIINVQGRKSRRRSPDDVERIIRENVAQGLNSFFITDDNFARNKDWEVILDRLIHLRLVEKIKMSFMIQVDTLCHKLPNFIEKCAAAGVKRAYIGLENINPDSLAGAHKRQNKITEYRKMLQAWKAARRSSPTAVTFSGFRTTRRNRSSAMCEIVMKELPLDILEFFFLTPLPGSEDHQKLVNSGVEIDAGPEQVRSESRLRAASRRCRGRIGSGPTARRGRRITRTSTWRRCCAGSCRNSAPPATRSCLIDLVLWARFTSRGSIRSRAGCSGTSSGAIGGRDCRSSRAGSFIRSTRSNRW